MSIFVLVKVFISSIKNIGNRILIFPVCGDILKTLPFVFFC